MMNRKATALTLLAAGALAAFGLPQIASATSAIPCETGAAPSNVFSCATGVYVDLSVLGGAVTATVGPVANAFGTAPAPYTAASTLVTVNSFTSVKALGLLGSLGVNTGIITDSASSPYNGTLATLSSTGTSTVNNLSIALGIPAIFPLPAISAINIGATTLTSTSFASKTTGLITTSGSSLIDGLVISVLGTPVTIDASALVNAPVNDYLVNVGGLQIIANYQTAILEGTDRIGTQTSALAVLLNKFGYGTGGGLLNGEILIANSAAAVPEPATWAMMILGFGLVGAMARRRQFLTTAPVAA